MATANPLEAIEAIESTPPLSPLNDAMQAAARCACVVASVAISTNTPTLPALD